MPREFMQVFDALPADGWLTLEEARAIWTWAGHTVGDLLEVGCYVGRSTCLLASLGRRLHCVDPWADGFHSELPGDEILRRWLSNVSAFDNITAYRLPVEAWDPRGDLQGYPGRALSPPRDCASACRPRAGS